MIIRAKTKELFEGKALTDIQMVNTSMNIQELESGEVILHSKPRRIVLELTNACNLNCIMCGRNAVEFKHTQFEMEWFYSLEPLFDTVEEVTLMGWGEPTVHPHFDEMLQVLAKHSARIYFCTNGMRLNKLHNQIFENGVDVFAVSVDGASHETNSKIRRGSDLNEINASLKRIVAEKKDKHLKYPYINYVFCAMKSNIHELPDLVKMAADIGLNEVKVVFLTVFDQNLIHETLFGDEVNVKQVFDEAEKCAEELNINLKLPYIYGVDPAGTSYHRDCYVAYRDFYLGSDGYVRPCMSTSEKFFKYDTKRDFMDMWNSLEYQNLRNNVNNENMSVNCKNCYQSSHCNWNNRKSYIQLGEKFAPSWEEN